MLACVLACLLVTVTSGAGVVLVTVMSGAGVVLVTVMSGLGVRGATVILCGAASWTCDVWLASCEACGYHV